MASVDFFTGFTYKWAQTGAVFDWQDDQYKLGWATIGSTPPTVEQFNRVLQVSDEKSNWLYGQLKTVADAKSVTLSAGSLTGLQQVLAAYTPDATETIKGIAAIATNAEVNAATNDTKFITPLKLANSFAARIVQATESVLGILKIATQAQTNAGTDDTTAVTPKKLRFGVSMSLLQNGYIALPSWLGGIIFQWGVSAFDGSTQLYPIPFPNAVFVVLTGQGNYNIDSAVPNRVVAVSAVSPTLTGFTGRSGTSLPSQGSFFAIGR